jgi:lipid II:glycine glycyltransferase (peptidoglycan interpeptide bridge formation enzyme)
MHELDSDYAVDIDNIDKDTWHFLLREFDDASIYQTWDYGLTKSKSKHLHHLVLKYKGEVVSVAQVRVTKVPGLPIGIAYVHWGPLWIKNNALPNTNHLKNMIRALQSEYNVKKKYLLKVLPKIVNPQIKDEVLATFAQEKYQWRQDSDETVLIDVSTPPEELKKYLHKDWRRVLRQAEEQEIRIIEGTSNDFVQSGLALVKEMKARKKYFGPDHHELSDLQRHLPEECKVWIAIAEYENEPVAVLGWQTLGKAGFPVIAATGDKGLKVGASNLLWWKMINYYHERGFWCLDVAGVSAERNPGGYRFKTRLAGKIFKQPDRYIGQFDSCEAPVTIFLFKLAYSLRKSYRNIRVKLANIAAKKAIKS